MKNINVLNFNGPGEKLTQEAPTCKESQFQYNFQKYSANKSNLVKKSFFSSLHEPKINRMFLFQKD